MSKPTRDEITKLAQECQLIGIQPHLDGIYQESLERFFHAAYAAGAAAEREACANIDWTPILRNNGMVTWGDAETLADLVSDAIRSRGKT